LSRAEGRRGGRIGLRSDIVVVVFLFLPVVFVVGVVGPEAHGGHQGGVIDFKIVGGSVLAGNDSALVDVTQVNVIVIIAAIRAVAKKGEFCDAQVSNCDFRIVGLDDDARHEDELDS